MMIQCMLTDAQTDTHDQGSAQILFPLCSFIKNGSIKCVVVLKLITLGPISITIDNMDIFNRVLHAGI